MYFFYSIFFLPVFALSRNSVILGVCKYNESFFWKVLLTGTQNYYPHFRKVSRVLFLALLIYQYSVMNCDISTMIDNLLYRNLTVPEYTVWAGDTEEVTFYYNFVLIYWICGI